MAAFFGVCLVCHGELAKDRPPPEHLTAFYFWMSLGGVIGGLFNALVAPIVFHKLGMVEYPLALDPGRGGAAALEETANGPSASPRRRVARARLARLRARCWCSSCRATCAPDRARRPRCPDGAAASRRAHVRRCRRWRRSRSCGGRHGTRCPLRRSSSPARSIAVRFGETLHMERNFFGVVRVTKSPDGRVHAAHSRHDAARPAARR